MSKRKQEFNPPEITRFIIKTDGEIDANKAVFEWVEITLLMCPPYMKMRKDQYFLAIPNIVQRMMLRHLKRQIGNTQIEFITSKNHDAIFDRLFDWKVVPGYEMAVVLYHWDGAIDPEKVYRVPFEIIS